jgi:2-polyprenyl-6-methoxyphenol hydroxylase-like FAD-dependent oxidoreductase
MVGHACRRFSSGVIRVPVCIVGGGPTGQIASKLLTSYGVEHALVEPRVEPTSHPQAHFINARRYLLLPVSFFYTLISLFS